MSWSRVKIPAKTLSDGGHRLAPTLVTRPSWVWWVKQLLSIATLMVDDESLCITTQNGDIIDI